MLTPAKIVDKVETLKSQRTVKNAYMEEILALREGRWEDVFPDMLPENFNRPFVSNLIDLAARDTSEVIAPLPSFNCESARTNSERARLSADKRTQIANYYVDCSNLQAQMYSAADRLLTYGYAAFMVQPDLKREMPRILADNTFRTYYQQSPFGDETFYYARVFKRHVNELMLEFPDAAQRLMALKPANHRGDLEIQVVRWWDKDQQALVTVEGRILLTRVDNPLDRCPVRVVEMPKLGECVRGQYDDAVGVMAARTLAQKYALEAMEESVNAQIAVPNDVQEFGLGPKALLRTENPEKVRRIDLNVPPGVFAEAQNLTMEARLATRYPEGRSGQLDASIITGQGVEALLGAYSTQIKTAQMLLAAGLRDIIGVCFEMDEKLWPRTRKSAEFLVNGSQKSVTYVPATDIHQDYSCEVSYGMTAGLDPNRATVLVLQNLSAGLISKRTAMAELPFDINIEKEKAQIDVEMQRDALTQAIAGYAQAIPMMATQGMDPAQAVVQIAEVIRQREKGKPMEEAVAAVFSAPPPASQQAPSPDQGAPGQAPPGQPEAEPSPFDPQTGLPPGVAEGQAQYGAGGAQDLLMMLAGTKGNGDPNLAATTSRRIPA